MIYQLSTIMVVITTLADVYEEYKELRRSNGRCFDEEHVKNNKEYFDNILNRTRGILNDRYHMRKSFYKKQIIKLIELSIGGNDSITAFGKMFVDYYVDVFGKFQDKYVDTVLQHCYDDGCLEEFEYIESNCIWSKSLHAVEIYKNAVKTGNLDISNYALKKITGSAYFNKAPTYQKIVLSASLGDFNFMYECTNSNEEVVFNNLEYYYELFSDDIVDEFEKGFKDYVSNKWYSEKKGADVNVYIIKWMMDRSAYYQEHFVKPVRQVFNDIPLSSIMSLFVDIFIQHDQVECLDDSLHSFNNTQLVRVVRHIDYSYASNKAIDVIAKHIYTGCMLSHPNSPFFDRIADNSRKLNALLYVINHPFHCMINLFEKTFANPKLDECQYESSYYIEIKKYSERKRPMYELKDSMEDFVNYMTDEKAHSSVTSSGGAKNHQENTLVFQTRLQDDEMKRYHVNIVEALFAHGFPEDIVKDAVGRIGWSFSDIRYTPEYMGYVIDMYMEGECSFDNLMHTIQEYINNYKEGDKMIKITIHGDSLNIISLYVRHQLDLTRDSLNGKTILDDFNFKDYPNLLSNDIYVVDNTFFVSYLLPYIKESSLNHNLMTNYPNIEFPIITDFLINYRYVFLRD